MDKNNSDLVDKIRQQFDTGPYPRTPLEKSPKNDASFLYIHSLVTAYYLRNQRFIETEGKVILDAGCGTGYKSLVLAEANPGARIVGVDISDESIKLAQERLKYHGFENTEFHTLGIEDLAQLGKEFDYINCDEVLYLLPDIGQGLQAMQSVLKPDGIIRANLHSSLQRVHFYRAQELFKMMGLMDSNPQELEMQLVWETMRALKDQVSLKKNTWGSQFDADKELTIVNHLLQGDKGYTIPELFSAFETADLEFISMVNWRQWELMDLFKNPDDLPVFLGLALPETSLEERLHFYELLNPVHRLLDFWCGHPNQSQTFVPVAEWTITDWWEAKVYLHPQLKTAAVQTDLVKCITELHPFEISKHLPMGGRQISVDSTIAACLFPPLLNSAQSMQSLVKRWQILRPIDPLTGEATTEDQGMSVLTQTLTGLEDCGYVLLCRDLSKS